MFNANQKCIEVRFGTFYLDRHALQGIRNPSRKAHFRGEPVDEWAKPDTLDGSMDHDSNTRYVEHPTPHPPVRAGLSH